MYDQRPPPSGTHAIFKGTGAMKFKQIPPRRSEHGYVERNGAILLEMAPAVGKTPQGLPQYDWKGQKISFSIGVQDITALVDKPTDRLFHKYSDTITKTLSFQPGEGKYEGTWRVYLNENKRSIMVPLTSGEYMILQRLFVTSIPMMIAWD